MSISTKSIARIKIASKEAGLDDAGYREVLRGFGVSSCKDLTQNQVGAVLRALGTGGKRRGWQQGQLDTVEAYRAFAGMSGDELGELVLRETGQAGIYSEHLGQFHFDRVMALLETRAHLAEVNGRGVGARPRRITDWWYWRGRSRGDGRASRRQLFRIGKLWRDFRRMPCHGESLPATYLFGMVESATRGKATRLGELSQAQAAWVIEALADRLKWAARKRA